MKRAAKRRAGRIREMEPEYDFSNAVRGKHGERFKDVVMVTLAPDVVEVFPDADSVNRTLRGLIKLMAPTRTRAASRRKGQS